MFDELVIRGKNGDKAAKEEILRSLEPLIIRSIERYYYKKKDFEDLFQDGNIKVLECIEDYQATRGTHFLGYVKTMLKYMYLDKHKTKVHSSLNIKLENGDQELVDLLVSQDQDILEAIVSQEEIKDLNKVLEDLTPRQKQVIVLFYIEKMSLNEIASTLDVAYWTVVNTKGAALKKIKSLFKA